MKRKMILLMSLLMCSIATIFAQVKTGSIKGKVITSDGKPAVGVSIQMKGSNGIIVTDEDGQFIAHKVKPGVHTLQITLVGAETIEHAVTVEEDKTASLDFKLKESSKELGEVIVTAGRNKFAKKESDYVARMPLSNIENAQVYNVVSKELLKEQVIVNFDDAVKNLPGVNKLWTSTGRSGDGAGYFSMRGFSVQPTMINGIAGLTNGGIDPANVERIESIKGPSGTLFGSSLISFGGLLNIVTKKPYETLGGEISYTAGGFGLSRLTADVNTPLNKEGTVLFRVNTSSHYEGNFQDAGFKKSYFVAPSLAFKANSKLSFLLNA
ncbi:MAG: TonB-dependent receptor, partial [Sphingobacteriales bacterium]|nr:TonB-dependent receptor [Sphingobacteriales bacterium]